jgi:hypothetical protein
MHLPYTNDYPGAVTIAGEVVGVTLTAVLWSRSFRSRLATIALNAAIGLAALLPVALGSLEGKQPPNTVLLVLQVSATLATLAMLNQRSHWLKALGVVGQGLLLAVTLSVRDSDFELIFLYLFWYGLLIGAHLWWSAPPLRDQLVVTRTRGKSFAFHDALIFALTVPVAFFVTNSVFGRLVYNGDEVANSYQADVYGHFHAYGPIPPCASMFENYWVFRHDGHAFSQYTPGWPLFMGLFARFGVIYLAGPFMGGIAAVGIARLSRRLAAGLGATPESSWRITALAGFLGPVSALAGPSMLLNAASRFSHTMVCACFAWAIESLCLVVDSDDGRGHPWWHGCVLGSCAALMLATRPADGALLGVGIFAYFAYAAARKRVRWQAWLGTAFGFAVFGGLTAVILRLQLGEWFQTAYKLAPSVHGEAKLVLSWPKANEVRYGIPLATGSYCWWPAAPALGIAGLVRALGGRERRVVFILVVSECIFLSFYFLIEFGRGVDDGLGPRYFLPLVVAMAPGGAALLAPLLERVPFGRVASPGAWLRSIASAACVVAAMVYGVARIAPLLYPVAEREYKHATAPFRGAKELGLKKAIVMIVPGRSTEHETNLAQNAPFDTNPDVLFLIRRSRADETCAREHFPGRTWYRAGLDEKLPRY